MRQSFSHFKSLCINLGTLDKIKGTCRMDTQQLIDDQLTKRATVFSADPVNLDIFGLNLLTTEMRLRLCRKHMNGMTSRGKH